MEVTVWLDEQHPVARGQDAGELLGCALKLAPAGLNALTTPTYDPPTTTMFLMTATMKQVGRKTTVPGSTPELYITWAAHRRLGAEDAPTEDDADGSEGDESTPRCFIR